MTAGGDLDRALARLTQIESLAQHRAERPEPLPRRRRRNGRGARDDRVARAVDVTAERLDAAAPRAPAAVSDRDAASGQRLRAVGIAARQNASTRDCPATGWTKTTAACASQASRSAVAPSRASRAGITAASTIRRTSASSPSIWTPT